MFQRLPPRPFAAFLADLWKRQGWQTSLRDREDGTFLVVGRRGNGTRGMLYAVPGTERTVGRKRVEGFARSCRKKGVSVAVVATQGEFTPEARKLAERADVHLLDSEVIRATIEEGGFHEVLRRHARAAGIEEEDDAGDEAEAPLADRLPGGERLAAILALVAAHLPGGLGIPDRVGIPGSSSVSLPGSLPVSLPAAASGSVSGRFDQLGDGDAPVAPTAPYRRLAVLVVLAFVLFAGGAAFGHLALGTGGSTASGPPVTAVSTAGENATLRANWSAAVVPSVTASNGDTYHARDGETFVVVQFNVTDTADSPGQLHPEDLAFESNGRRYAYQPLNGTRTFHSGLFAPGETTSVWVAFSVPSDTTGGTIVVRRRGDATPRIRFVHDPSLPVAPAER